jgi:hypothetical protein
MKKKGGHAALAACMGMLAMTSCGSGDLTRVEPGSGAPTTSGPTARGTRSVAGVQLAQVNVTSTHTVAFWEVRPGSVMMMQKLNAGAGDKSLDLGSMLLDAGGTYAGLYRKLLNDPNATPSPELLAADERRQHLPIRDASLPLPQRVVPHHAPRTLGAAATKPSQTAAQPGALRTQTLTVWNDFYDNRGIDFNCHAREIDSGWCPPGAYNNYIYGDSDEAIFYDSEGYNPQAYPADNGFENDDTYTVWEWTAAEGWVNDLNWDLYPGETLRTTFVGTPTYYEGEVDGNVVAFADGQRLSFPQITQVATWPLWTSQPFSNDINGITHDSSRWILSRTDNGPLIGGDSYGVMGRQDFVNDLQQSGPDRYSGGEPAAWVSAHYNHYGDIVYDAILNTLFVSINKDGGLNAAIGVLNAADSFRIVGQASILGTDRGQHDCPWVAMNPKIDSYSQLPYLSREFYTSEKSLPLIHRNTIQFPNGVTTGGGITTVALPDINLLNPIGYTISDQSGPQPLFTNTGGAKVSSHGKLWVFASVGGTFQILGIDPYSGIIQVQALVAYSGGGFTSLEGEGLDITPTDPHAPGISGQIHVQLLGNKAPPFNDVWSLANFTVSDLSRL